MASLMSTIPQYLFLTLRIYILRSLLLALSAIDYTLGVILGAFLAYSASTGGNSRHGGSISRDSDGRPADGLADEERCGSDDESADSELDELFTRGSAPDDIHTIEAISFDLERLIGSLAKSVQSLAAEEYLAPQSDTPGFNSPLSSRVSLLGNSVSSRFCPLDIEHYSTIMKPHTARRFSPRAPDLAKLLKSPSVYLGSDLSLNINVSNDTNIEIFSEFMALSRQDGMTSLELNTDAINETGVAEEASLQPTLLWSPSAKTVEVSLSIRLKRTRRRKASSVVVWSNEGEHGNLTNVLGEIGRL